ncbi:MAG: adenosylcobinamide amidohydrolase [Lachnospiraceae bacterium]|nr:adenosylcobinamide amidohydrolase [Lachnospiraceae bacterium]
MSEKGEILITMSDGDRARRYYNGIIIDFSGPRKVVSTSLLNGGYREDLKAVFNFNCLAEEMACRIKQESYEKEIAANAEAIGLNPTEVSGLTTAAWMEKAAIEEETFKDITVMAIVTAGIDSNATRIGDPASFYEETGKFVPIEPGTINILLHLSCDLPAGALTKCITLSSIAKAVTCEELLLGSLYSHGFATGSGTDGIIVVANPESTVKLTDVGEHSKLGELIGRVTKKAVRKALYNQSGVCAARSHKIRARIKRYGLTTGTLWDYYENNKDLFISHNIDTSKISLPTFEKIFDEYDDNSTAVIWCSQYLMILDQLETGMIEWAEAYRETGHISKHFWEDLGLIDIALLYRPDSRLESVEELIDQMKYVLLVALFKVQLY